MTEAHTFTVFAGHRRIGTAPLPELLALVKGELDAAPGLDVTVLDDRTGRTLSVDLRGPLEEVLARAHWVLAPQGPASSGPGRPKLGVTAREVTLLPRHWEWLESHPGGASATLRRLIDEARRADPEGERRRLSTLSTDRFLTALGGDLPGAEEASRALYRADAAAFAGALREWPEDLRLHALHLAAPALGE